MTFTIGSTAKVLRACIGVGLLSASVAAQSSYVPQRVFNGPRGEFTDFETMIADLASADVVFLGEQHDDPNTHRLELAVLEALARRRGGLTLSLEMFERDVQEPLMHFSMGHTDEAEFLKDARPWPRYATDYKPLVDLAVSKNWNVVAANVPRPLASDVSKSGLDVLKGKPADQQGWYAHDLQCPTDDHYYERFVEAMGGHPAAKDGKNDAAAIAAAKATTTRYYQSQCLKDETMAESIAQAVAIGATGKPPGLVVHVTGAFHADFREGTVARVKRRASDKRLVVVSIVPVKSLDDLKPEKSDRKRGDYLLYTIGK